MTDITRHIRDALIKIIAADSGREMMHARYEFDKTCTPAALTALLARLDAAEAAYIESVRLHNLTLDELRVSESENFHADAHKLALVLEALLMSTKDDSACAKLWDMAHEALEQHRQLVDETYPQEYVSAFGKD